MELPTDGRRWSAPRTRRPGVLREHPTAAPDTRITVGAADLKVASFNVLNYFTTSATRTASCTAFTTGPATASRSARLRPARCVGRRRPRAAAEKDGPAINALDADVVGLMEIENSAALDSAPDEASATLVDALNARRGPRTGPSSRRRRSSPPPPTGRHHERDHLSARRSQRVGASRALGTESADGQAFDNAREPIGQVFPAAGGERLLFVVNHFKSKGSAGPGPETPTPATARAPQ